MALALLWAETLEDDGSAPRLRFDVGHNNYYVWQLGDQERITSNGIARLANVKQRSRMFGPLPESARGRGVLEIPPELISKEDRFVQLLSFRTEDRAGPAISPIVEMDWTNVGRGPQSIPDDLPPPALFATTRGSVYSPQVLASALSNADGGFTVALAQTYSSMPARRPPVDAAPLRWRERNFSQAMFFQGLLTSILPSLAPTIGRFVGGLFSGGPGGSPTTATTATTGASPQISQLIEQLVRAIGGNTTPATPAAPTTPATTATTHSLAFGSLGARIAQHQPHKYSFSRSARKRTLRNPRAMQYAQAQEYSQAMIAPALLAAIPALMPVLQQVLTPQTIQSVVDAPQRATGQIMNGLMDFARIGMQATEQERAHLRQLNPGVDDPALHQLLMSMSQGFAAAQRLNYRRVASVKLTFDEAQSQMLFGRSRVLYRKDQALQFPLSVNTPKTISGARLVLQIKHPDTLAVLVEDGEDVGELSSGPVPIVPRIDEAMTARLEPNQDYIVMATLLWKNKKKQQVGTSMQQRITLIGEYSFDRVEEGGDLIAASDFEQYRDLWHKVWQGDFGSGAHTARLDCRYYLVLNPKRTNNARLDTHVKSQNGDFGGKLKTGMEYSPYVLNHLLTRLVPDTNPLSDAEIEALSGNDFVERFNQAAQFRGKLKGRRGESGALWTYPEFKIQTLVLTRAAEVDENGNVRTLEETRVRFPMPVMMHFVGVKGA